MFDNCYGKAGLDDILRGEFSREYAKQAELGLDANQTAQKTYDALSQQKAEEGQYRAYRQLNKVYRRCLF